MRKKEIRFFIFGDSICYGQLISHHKTWAAKLSEKLSSTKSQNRVLIQNASVNGNTTRLALERISYDVITHSPDLLLVQFGMNDCNFWRTDFGMPRVTKEAFRANIIEIVRKAISSGVKHIFLNTNHPSLKGNFDHNIKMTHSQSNSEYNQVIRSAFDTLSKNNNKNHITLIDIEKSFLNEFDTSTDIKADVYLLSDGIHLSQEGHELYYKIIEPIINQKYKELYE